MGGRVFCKTCVNFCFTDEVILFLGLLYKVTPDTILNEACFRPVSLTADAVNFNFSFFLNFVIILVSNYWSVSIAACLSSFVRLVTGRYAKESFDCESQFVVTKTIPL